VYTDRFETKDGVRNCIRLSKLLKLLGVIYHCVATPQHLLDGKVKKEREIVLDIWLAESAVKVMQR